MPCIFCQIIANQSPSSKIYEDDHILAFLDIHPVRPGQVLVIPKIHVDHFSDLPEELATRIFQKAHELSKIIREKLQPQRVGLMVHGYGVAHAHMIIVPQIKHDDITTGRMATIEHGEIVFRKAMLPVATREELDNMATLLRRE